MTIPLLDLWLADLWHQRDDGPSHRIRHVELHSVASESTATATAEDVALAERVRAGDRDAFAALFDRYYIPLCVFANRFVHDMEAAREIVSEMLYQLWVRREEWTPVHGIAAYCFGAVRHRVTNTLRDGRTRAQLMAQTAAAAGHPAVVPDAPPLPDALSELHERATCLWEAVAQLPERQQLVITLRWQQGLTFDEIAAITGVSRPAAQMLADRAIKALRLRLSALED